MIRPPCGSWCFICRNAACAHRNEPVRLVSMTALHTSGGTSSSGAPVPNVPALLTRTSTRPQRATTAANSAPTDSADRTSAGTTRVSPAAPASPPSPPSPVSHPAPAPVITTTGGAAGVPGVTRRRPSGGDRHGHGLGVADPAEVHDLDQRPP